MERVSVLVEFDCPGRMVQLQSPPSKEDPSAYWQDKFATALRPLGEDGSTFRCVLFGSLVEVAGHLWQHQVLWVCVQPSPGQAGEKSYVQADIKDIVEPSEVEEVERSGGGRYRNVVTLYDDLTAIDGAGKANEVSLSITLEVVTENLGLPKASLEPTLNEVFVLRLQLTQDGTSLAARAAHKGPAGRGLCVRFGGVERPLQQNMCHTLVLVSTWNEVPKALTELDVCVQAPTDNDVVDLPVDLAELVVAAAERGGADGVSAQARSEKLPCQGDGLFFHVAVQSLYWSSSLGRLQAGPSKDAEQLWTEGLIANPRTWRVSVEIRSLRLTAGTSNAFIVYAYELLQQPRPFRTNPPVLARKNQTVYLPHGFAAYTLAATAEELTSRLEHPLRVEIWHRDIYKKDSILGFVEFALGSIFDRPIQYSASMPSMACGFRALDQVCPVIGVGTDGKIGALRLVFFVEDLGPANVAVALAPLAAQAPPTPAIAPLGSGLWLAPSGSSPEVAPDSGAATNAVDAASNVIGVARAASTRGPNNEVEASAALEGLQALRTSPEYSAAFELELWKRAEENKFRSYLKEQEVALRAQLEDEYRQRELQRAKEFRTRQGELKDVEAKVRKKFQDLQQREVALVAEEVRVASLRDEVKRRTDVAIQEHEDAARRQSAEAQHGMRLERDKGRYLEAKLAEVEAELTSSHQRFKDLEAELDERRKSLDSFPVSRLQQELQETVLQLRDAERRNEVLASSRDHFKSKVEELCQRFFTPAPRATTLGVAPVSEPAEGQHVQADEPSMLQALRQLQDQVSDLGREWSSGSSRGLKHVYPAPSLATPVSVAIASPGFVGASRPPPAFEVAASNTRFCEVQAAATDAGDASRHIAWLRGQREELLQSGLYLEGDPVLCAIDARISEALSRAGGISG